MTWLDNILESLVLAHDAPFKQVDVSGCGTGTVEESNAAGGLTRSGLTSPFKATGICQRDEYVGACVQEVWEGAWQQWALILACGACLAIIAVATLIFGGIGAGVAAAASAALLYVTASFQTAQSEITSHEISWEASVAGGMTPARADECFVANLQGYDYGGFSGMTETDFKARMVAKRSYVRAYLARPNVAALCQRLAGAKP